MTEHVINAVLEGATRVGAGVDESTKSARATEYVVVTRRVDSDAPTEQDRGKQFTVIDACHLREAIHMAQSCCTETVLVRVFLLDRHSNSAQTGITIQARSRSIISLIHDITLLGIAQGVLLDTGRTIGMPESVLDEVVDGLGVLGHRAAWYPIR